LPFELEVDSFVRQDFEHRTFFTRLHPFVLSSDAFIVAKKKACVIGDFAR
jgi:hypothetical protein